MDFDHKKHYDKVGVYIFLLIRFINIPYFYVCNTNLMTSEYQKFSAYTKIPGTDNNYTDKIVENHTTENKMTGQQLSSTIFVN